MAEEEPIHEEDEDGLYDIPIHSPRPKNVQESPWPVLLLFLTANTPFISLMLASAWFYLKNRP